MINFISSIPIDLQGFLKYAGCIVDSYTQEDQVKKTKLLDFIATKSPCLTKSIPEVTGTDRIHIGRRTDTYWKKIGYIL